MSRLWANLMVQIGTGFIKQWGDVGGPVYDQWALELQGFHRDDIARGYQLWKDDSNDFLNLRRFRAFCQQAQLRRLGLPEIDMARRLVELRCWKKLHPAFQAIASESVEIKEEQKNYEGELIVVTTHRLRYPLHLKCDEKKAAERFKPYYEEVVRRVKRGEVFERREELEDQREHKDNPSGVVRKFGKDQGRKTLKDLLKVMKGA